MKHVEEKWDSSSQSQRTFSRKLTLSYNHYTTRLCFKVTVTIKSRAAKLAGAEEHWFNMTVISEDKMFQNELSQHPQHREWLYWATSKAQLVQHPLSSGTINRCPKEENKNRLSIYNTPVCLYLYMHIFPPWFHHQSLPAHWDPDVVSACSVAIRWFLSVNLSTFSQAM